MYYAIDHDTRQVESKSEDGDLLDEYVSKNGLSMAVTIINSADDLALCFSIGEMEDIGSNLVGIELDYPDNSKNDENDIADWCFDIITTGQDSIAEFTPKLGKKLLKEGSKRGSDKAVPQTDTNTSPTTKKPVSDNPGRKLTAKFLTDKMFSNTDKQARAGSAMGIIQSAIEENLGEATFEEIRGAFMLEKDCDEKYANGYISGSVREGYTQVDMGE